MSVQRWMHKTKIDDFDREKMEKWFTLSVICYCTIQIQIHIHTQYTCRGWKPHQIDLILQFVYWQTEPRIWFSMARSIELYEPFPADVFSLAQINIKRKLTKSSLFSSPSQINPYNFRSHTCLHVFRILCLLVDVISL